MSVGGGGGGGGGDLDVSLVFVVIHQFFHYQGEYISILEVLFEVLIIV